MQRVLVIHLPAFRVERCGWSPDELVALTDEWKSAVRLAALSPAAKAAGLRWGMSASEARAREPDIMLEPLDRHGELIDRLALAESLRNLSDRVGLLWDEDVGLDIAGTSHLFGGERGILERARQLVESFGHQCRLAVADDVLAAGALAHSSHDDTIIEQGQSAQALSPLPIDALRLTPDLRLALTTVGIDCIGEFARLDAASVSGRFGEEGVHTHRVANGHQGSDWLPVLQETSPIRVQTPLGGSTTTLEPVIFALRGITAQISAQLFRRDAVAVRLALRFGLEGKDSNMQLMRIRVGRPTRNPDTLMRVLHHRLEDLKLRAPALDLAVEVEESAPDSGIQPGLHDRTEATEAFSDLRARLADALGDKAIVQPVLVESWRPERAWRDGPLEGPTGPGRPSTMRVDPVSLLWRHQSNLKSPRPTLLLPKPQNIEVRSRFDQPIAMHMSRGWAPIARANGPERLQGEWWADDRGFDRDYWVVHLRDGTAWIYRDRERWYLHGWFD